MNGIRSYISLLRPKHYLKNILVFLPVFFGSKLLDLPTVLATLLGFVAFSLFSSVVYIINDLCDAERDRAHPEKKKRPIASGTVGQTQAIILLAVVLVMAVAAALAATGFSFALIVPAVYVLLNLSYSLKLKNYPIIDIALLVSGFFMRVLYGALVSGITISAWMYLAVISVSFFLAIGKRRNEKRLLGNETRPVVEKYSDNFLNMNMYVYLALFLAFYAIWAMQGEASGSKLLTIPLVMLIMLRYSYIVEHPDSHGDPVNVIIKDVPIIVLGLLYAVAMAAIIYFPEIFS